MHRLDGKYDVHGVALIVEVAPCSWMYSGYPLTVWYKSADDDRSQGTVKQEGLCESTASATDVQEMLEAHLTPGACVACGHGHLRNDEDNPNDDSSRGELCEVCFIARLNAKYDQLEAAERDALALEDRKQRRKGFTHRVTAWIHAGGDDRQIDIYYKGRPTAKEIRGLLKRKRSRVLNDYTIVTL